MLKRLTFTILLGLTFQTQAQTIRRLEDGDVIYGKVKQLIETHLYTGNPEAMMPEPFTLKVLTYEFDNNGKITNFKGGYAAPLGKKLHILEDEQFRYYKDSSGNQLIGVYENNVLKWTNRLNAEGKVIATTFVDKKGRVTGTRSITFKNDNMEAIFLDYDKKGKLKGTRKTKYSADGQLISVNFFDAKEKLQASYEFEDIDTSPGNNWTQRKYTGTQDGHLRYHLIKRQYVYYQ